jgi:hypothetical protein
MAIGRGMSTDLGVRVPPSARPPPLHRPCELRAARPRFRLRNALLGGKNADCPESISLRSPQHIFLSNTVLFRLKSFISVCSANSVGSKVPRHGVSRWGDSRVRVRSWRLEEPGPAPGNAGVRAGPGRGAPGGPGPPDSAGARSPETRADGLPLRVRPSRRPGSGGIAAHDRVILSDHDLAVIRRAVARARQDGKETRAPLTRRWYSACTTTSITW